MNVESDNYQQDNSNQNCDDKLNYALSDPQQLDSFHRTLVTSEHDLNSFIKSERTNTTNNDDENNYDENNFLYLLIYIQNLIEKGRVPRQFIKREDYCHIKNSPPNKFKGHDAIARIFRYLGFEKQCVAICLRDNILYVAYNNGITNEIKNKIRKALKSKTETELYNYILSECKANSKINKKLKEDNFLQNLSNDCKKSFENLKDNKLTLVPLDSKGNLHAEMVVLKEIIKVRKEEEAIYIGVSYLCCVLCKQVLEHYKIKFRGTHGVLYCGKSWSYPDFLTSDKSCIKKLIDFILATVRSYLQPENQLQVFKNVIDSSEPDVKQIEEKFNTILSPKNYDPNPINLNHDQSDDDEYNEPK